MYHRYEVSTFCTCILKLRIYVNLVVLNFHMFEYTVIFREKSIKNMNYYFFIILDKKPTQMRRLQYSSPNAYTVRQTGVNA